MHGREICAGREFEQIRNEFPRGDLSSEDILHARVFHELRAALKELQMLK